MPIYSWSDVPSPAQAHEAIVKIMGRISEQPPEHLFKAFGTIIFWCVLIIALSGNIPTECPCESRKARERRLLEQERLRRLYYPTRSEKRRQREAQRKLLSQRAAREKARAHDTDSAKKLD